MSENKTHKVWWLSDDSANWQSGIAITEDQLPTWWDGWGLLRTAEDVYKMANWSGMMLAEDVVGYEDASRFAEMASDLVAHLRDNTNVSMSECYLYSNAYDRQELSLTLLDDDTDEERILTVQDDMALSYMTTGGEPIDLSPDAVLIRDWLISHQEQYLD